MQILMRYLILLSALISFTQLSGCASPGKNLLPKGGDLTMAQIYEKETGLQGSDNVDDSHLAQLRNEMRSLGLSKPTRVNYDSYTVHSSNEIKQLFGQLPNPQIPIYVFPHLVYSGDEATPVPGYTTAFFLYKQNHFAMPSEGL